MIISLLIFLLALAIAIWLFKVALNLAVLATKIAVICGGIFVLFVGCLWAILLI